MRYVVAIMALIVVEQTPATQPPAMDTGVQARVLLDAAVQVHGGQDAWRAVERIHLVLEGQQTWQYQSRRPEPPYDQEAERAELMIDLPNQRLVNTSWRTYPGGIPRHSSQITDGTRGYSVDFRSGTHLSRTASRPERQTGTLHYLPQFILRDLVARADQLRPLGRRRLTSGAEVDVVAAGSLTVGFDTVTHELRALLHTVQTDVAADVPIEHEFLGYRNIDGRFMPTRRVTRSGGMVIRDLEYTAIHTTFDIPDEVPAPPTGSIDVTGAPAPVGERQLAPGVWTLGGSSSVLVVAFRDHVLVVDAPSGAESTVSRIASLAPGKPIKYIIPTHHHIDHAGGVRHFVEAGATLVTTAANRPFLEQVALARSARSRDALRVEVIAGASRVFSDGTRTVEIHNIGAGPHAQDMFVAWIPEEGVLFQADLIESLSGGILGPGLNNATTMHFAAWLKTKNWPVAVFAGSHGFLPDRAAFEALVKQPLIPLFGPTK